MRPKAVKSTLCFGSTKKHDVNARLCTVDLVFVTPSTENKLCIMTVEHIFRLHKLHCSVSFSVDWNLVYKEAVDLNGKHKGIRSRGSCTSTLICGFSSHNLGGGRVKPFSTFENAHL